MSSRAARRRFLVTDLASTGQLVELPADQAHHLRVMRLAAGERVVLFDGAGVEATAEIVDPAAGQLRVVARRAVGAGRLHACLVQAVPVKLPRMDTIVQQATELGVARVVPVVSERGKVPGGGIASLLRRHSRWLRVAETAAKQCGRAVLPRIDAPVALAELQVEDLPTPVLLLAAGGDDMAVAAVDAGSAVAAVTLMVGPEGGWSEREQQRLVAAGAATIGLGPRTLRADTAGAVALAVAQYLWGDLRGER